MEQFNRYIGVQGVLAFILVMGYIVAIFTATVLPEGYSNLMTLILGFYFAKNGIGLLATLTGKTVK